MKAKFLLIFVIFLAACGASRKVHNANIFDTVTDKEYAGKVETTVYVKQGSHSFTLIQTDKESLPVKGNVDVKKGTKCYYFYGKNSNGKKAIFVVWDGAKQVYELNK
jgi:hypothetical protein